MKILTLASHQSQRGKSPMAVSTIHFCLGVLLIAALVTMPLKSVRAEDKATIAVVDFEAVGTSASNAVTVTQFVRTALVNMQAFTVVEKGAMEKVLVEQAFQQTGCTSQECAVKLGRILNVRKILMGSYSLFQGAQILTARLVDVETGKIERSATENLRDAGDLERATTSLVNKVVGIGAHTVPRPDVRAENLYQTAVARYNARDYRGAIQNAEAAVQADPKHWPGLAVERQRSVCPGG